MRHFRPIGFALLPTLVLGGCTSGAGTSAAPEQVGSACASAAACYPNVTRDADAGTSAIRGTVLCLDRVPSGYCTHTCAADTDCCAVPGECKTGFPQVCAPFESSGQKMCFLSCESALVASGDAGDPNAYCGIHTSAAFSCRSSGGGSNNRKVCVP